MKKLLLAGAGSAIVLVAAVFVWFNFVRDDAPPAFELTDETEAAAEETAGTVADGDANGGDGGAVTDLEGTWTVATGSEAGYRVVEDLSNIQDFEAVGRTDAVTGSIDITDTTITAGSFEVAVAEITSDDERRDNAFRGQVMSADEFPTATLALTAPIELGSVPAAGEAVSATVDAELTLRGQTNPVSFTVDAQVIDGAIEVVGSVPVLFSDFGIANPSNPFVTVRDEGQVEVRLLLTAG